MEVYIKILANGQAARPVALAVAIGIICAYGLITLYTSVLQPIGKRRGPGGKKYRLPPGPKGGLLLGSLKDLAKAKDDTDHKWLRSLRNNYGEMATVHLGSKTWIFLNSDLVASEIINKQGTITNGRSDMPVLSGIVSRNGRSVLLPADQWQEKRRVMHQLISGTALKQYAEWQELESTQMMAEYLYQPDRWYRHHFRYANSVIHRIALGERLVKSGKELAELQNVVTVFTGSLGASLIDWFPKFARLPRALHFWRAYWEKIGQWNFDVFCSWWNPVQKEIEAGTAPPSFARDVLLNPESKFRESKSSAMYCAMQLIEAGSDTTRSTLNIFVMASIRYPEIFLKARQEVDALCDRQGELCYPLISDMEQMHYVCAIIKELLRWRPLFTITPEHNLTKDLEFEGYTFPEGTGFAINGVAISDDVEDSNAFKPERWLDGHETEVTRGIWQFGGGRRICVGYHLAQRSLFINVARLVLCYNLEAAGHMDDTILNHHLTTEPFPVRAKVRSERHRKFIIQKSKEAGVDEDAKIEV